MRFPIIDAFGMTRGVVRVTRDAFGLTWGAVGMTRGGFGVTWAPWGDLRWLWGGLGSPRELHGGTPASLFQ